MSLIRNRPFIAVFLIGITARLYHLFQPIRYDEAITYLYFVKLPLTKAIADYRLPNNHVFHTVLQKFFVGIFGNEIWVLRLPAFIAGCAIIPLTYLVARRLFNSTVALLSAAIVAGTGALILYSTNARGYALIVLATLVLVWLMLAANDAPRKWHWPLFAVVSALGLWTVPVMLYPLGGIVLWALLDRGTLPREGDLLSLRSSISVIAAATVGGIMAAILYLPVIMHSGLKALAGNDYVKPQDFRAFLDESLLGLGHDWTLFTTGLPPLVPHFIIATAIVGMCVRLTERPFRMPPLLAMLMWSVVLVLLMRHFPFPRVWLFLVPFIAIASAQGLTWLAARAKMSLPPPRETILAFGILATLIGYTIATRAVFQSRETGTLFEAHEIALKIETILQEGDLVRMGTFSPLMYWFERMGIDRRIIALGGQIRARRVLVVVNHGEGETVERYLEEFQKQPRPFVAETLATWKHATLLGVSPR